MHRRCLLGLDVGTSSSKAIVIDESGTVLGSGSAPHRLLTPRPGWTEQDPGDWWAAGSRSIRDAVATAGVTPESIRGIGLSGQMHGSVLLDQSLTVIRPALLWNDQRSAGHLPEIVSAAGGEAALINATGNAANTGFQAPKLLWVRQNEPGNFRRIRHVLLPKDYVGFKLTGVLASDVGDASGTLIFDIAARRWIPVLAAKLGLNPAWFPHALESGAVAGKLSAEAAAITGLAPGIPVVAGSGDNQCGAIGSGVVSAGQGLLILGTSGVIYAPTTAPKPHTFGKTPGLTHAMCAGDGSASTPGTWCVTGVTLSAAGALQWFRDVVAPGVPFENILAEAWSVPPGADGVRCLTQLAGERCPIRDPNARASFHGLALSHTRAHLARAVVEGVAFCLARTLEVVRELGVKIDRLRAVGGGAKSREWLGMVSDLSCLSIDRLKAEEGGAFGAALLAGVGAEIWPDIRTACNATISVADSIEPTAPATGLVDAYHDFGKLIAR